MKQAIKSVLDAWHKVSEETAKSCRRHSDILNNNNDNFNKQTEKTVKNTIELKFNVSLSKFKAKINEKVKIFEKFERLNWTRFERYVNIIILYWFPVYPDQNLKSNDSGLRLIDQERLKKHNF